MSKLTKIILRDFDSAGFRELPKNRLTGVVFASLLNPGFRTLLIFRIQTQIYGKGHSRARKAVAFMISSLNQSLSGAELIPGCEVAPGAVIKHPSGIVIGAGAVIGQNCTIQHGVTLGLKYVDKPRDNDGYPKIGENVTLGTHAVILGPVSIGNGAVIGANAIVTKDVGPNTILKNTPSTIGRND